MREELIYFSFLSFRFISFRHHCVQSHFVGVSGVSRAVTQSHASFTECPPGVSGAHLAPRTVTMLLQYY